MINAWSLLYDEIYGDEEMSPCKPDHKHEDDTVFTVGSGNTASADTYSFDTTNFADIKIDTSALETDLFASMDGVDFSVAPYEESICTSNLDDIVFADVPTPGIKDPSTRKYKEDESIEALKNYISTTYGGHYTSDNNSVQTLDLIAVSYTHLTLPTKRIV